jgi:hypothetical protein
MKYQDKEIFLALGIGEDRPRGHLSSVGYLLRSRRFKAFVGEQRARRSDDARTLLKLVLVAAALATASSHFLLYFSMRSNPIRESPSTKK